MFENDVEKIVLRRRIHDKIRGCFSCFFTFLLMLAAVSGVVAFGVAKTGLVQIPVLSRFYSEPLPTRLVLASATSLLEVVQSQIRSQFSPAVLGSSETVTVNLVLREEEITRGLHDALRGFSKNGLEFLNPQVVALEDRIEFYAKLRAHDAEVPVRLEIIPLLGEEMPFQIKKAYLGQFPVWHRLVNFVVQNAIRTQLRAAPQNFISAITVKNIILRPGEIEIASELKSEVLGSLR